jgi:lysozyme family protein
MSSIARPRPPRKTPRAAKTATPSTTPATAPAPRAPAARQNVDQIIRDLVRREGGFVDHPSDPGGATNMGVTIGTLSRWLGRRATVEEVRALTYEEAVSIYRQEYWSGPGFDRLDTDQRIAINAFDAGVMSGPRRGIEMLQRALRGLGGTLDVDGAIGPETNRVARQVQDRVGVAALQNALCDQRQAFYDGIIQRRPASQAFANGWRNRVNKFRIRGEVEEVRNVEGRRVEPVAAPPPPAPEDEIANAGRALPPPPPAPSAARDPAVIGGAATGGLAAVSAAQEILAAAQSAQAAADAFPWLRVGLAVAVVIAAGVLAYGFYRARQAAAAERAAAAQEI